MKTIYMAMFALLTPLCASSQNTYVIGTALGSIADNKKWNEGQIGFYKINHWDGSKGVSYIMHSDLVGGHADSRWVWDQWFSHHPERHAVLDMPLSQLPSLGAVDVEYFLSGYNTKAGMVEWAKSVYGYGKTVYVIDRSEFYKSSQSLAEPDRMKVREVDVSWDMPDIKIQLNVANYPARPLFVMMPSNQYSMIRDSPFSPYYYSWPTKWSKPILDGQLPYKLVKSTNLRYYRGGADIFHYASTSEADKATGYDVIRVWNSVWTQCKIDGKFANLRAYSASANVNKMAAVALNPYFVDVPCTNGTLIMVIGQKEIEGKNQLVIFAVVGDDVKIVYNRFVKIESIDCSIAGRFDLVMSHGRIFEKDGTIWLEE